MICVSAVLEQVHGEVVLSERIRGGLHLLTAAEDNTEIVGAARGHRAERVDDAAPAGDRDLIDPALTGGVGLHDVAVTAEHDDVRIARWGCGPHGDLARVGIYIEAGNRLAAERPESPRIPPGHARRFRRLGLRLTPRVLGSTGRAAQPERSDQRRCPHRSRSIVSPCRGDHDPQRLARDLAGIRLVGDRHSGAVQSTLPADRLPRIIVGRVVRTNLIRTRKCFD